MHSLFAMELPFRHRNKIIHINRVCHEPLDLDANRILDVVSPTAKDLIRSMLTKDPQ